MNYTNERGLRNNNVVPAGGPIFGESPASGPAPTTAGHHKHDILNKLDPRVDSTKDKRSIVSGNGTNIPEGTYGPHSSRLANALDPRVDSDLDGKGGSRAVGGPTTTMRGAGGGVGSNNQNIPEGTYGPHSSRLANTLDPRVDSDADRSRMAPGGTMGGVGAGYGGPGPHHHQGGMLSDTGGVYHNNTAMMGSGLRPASKTVGPHKSDLLNKLDPRVGSKTGAFSSGSGAYGGCVN